MPDESQMAHVCYGHVKIEIGFEKLINIVLVCGFANAVQRIAECLQLVVRALDCCAFSRCTFKHHSQPCRYPAAPS